MGILAASSIVYKNNKILLLKRGLGVKTYRGYWQFPEGKVRINEDPKDAARRELYEETRVKADKLKFLTSSPVEIKSFNITIPIGKRMVYMVVDTNSNTNKIELSREHSDYGWYTLEKALKLKLVPGMAIVLKKL